MKKKLSRERAKAAVEIFKLDDLRQLEDLTQLVTTVNEACVSKVKNPGMYNTAALQFVLLQLLTRMYIMARDTGLDAKALRGLVNMTAGTNVTAAAGIALSEDTAAEVLKALGEEQGSLGDDCKGESEGSVH